MLPRILPTFRSPTIFTRFDAVDELVKVIMSGEIKKPVTLKGLRVSKGARAAITAAGGRIED